MGIDVQRALSTGQLTLQKRGIHCACQPFDPFQNLDELHSESQQNEHEAE